MENTTADFRSDTVTKPTKDMLDAMTKAPIGDDVLGDDPTVKRLESIASEMFGMESGLFCPSGTMTNQIAINVHCRPGEELICSPLSHIYNYEGGGVAFNSGVQIRTGGDNYGRIFPEDIKRLIQPEIDVHAAQSRLVVVENTSNKGGGTCLGVALLKDLAAIARSNGLNYHLDGARVFNAIVRDNESSEDYNFFDTISICLSKGLGAPVGSLLLGNKDFISQGKRVRKRFGGGMRQSGYLAAAGIYALENNINRLSLDHDLAQRIFIKLSQLDFIAEIKPVQSNIVLFRVKNSTSTIDLHNHLLLRNILIILMDKDWMRIVTHLDIKEKHIQDLFEGLSTFS
jgi:threonine aldolase|tara:strand:+ start:37344 stop:38372 length:1029 start_codon:yes stop_codon:yes gene_type:complete